MPNTPANDLNIQDSGYITHNGAGVFHGRTFQAGTGITLTNADGISGNTTIASTASLTDLHTARFIVASSTAGTGANFTTITAAIAAAQGTGINSTIFLQPGTYTENFSLPANINLCAYECDAFTPNVTIVGNITATGAGSRSISGIRLQTNSAAFLTVSANAAIVVNLINCYLNCTNNTGISLTSASASALIDFKNCTGDLGTTGIALYTSTSPGAINFTYCVVTNSGGSTTQSSNSAGAININHSNLTIPILTTSTGTFLCANSFVNTANQSATAFTGAGSIYNCFVASGSASAISASASVTINCYNSIISSSNTNAISGSGTLVYSGLSFVGGSAKINTTTQTGGVLPGGLSQAPGTGFIGQRIESTATNVATTSGTAKTITSISLTAGIWDVSALSYSVATGGTLAMTANQCNISTTDNTITGTAGIEYAQNNGVGTTAWNVMSASVPSYRVTLTATTTYYLVVVNVYTSTTCPTNGRLSATRVG